MDTSLSGRMWHLPIWAALISVAGCTPPEEQDTRAALVTDSAGVQIVSNGDVGSLGELEVTETLRLGVLEGEGPEQFSRIVAVAFGPDGGIVVGNNGSVTARIFGPDGTFETEVGGRGEGPSEVSSVNDVMFIGDTVLIIDWQRGGKAVAFTRAGAFAAGWSFLRSDGQRAIPAYRDSEGWLAFVISETPPPPLKAGEAWRRTTGIHRVSFESDDVGPKVYEAPSTVLYGVDGSEGGVDWSLLPEAWYTGFDAAGRLFVTDHETYRIDVFDGDGLVRSVRKSYQPRPFTERDVEDIIEESVHVIDTMSRIPEQYRIEQVASTRRRVERQARLPRPATVPPLAGLLVSRDGSFWVERADVHPPWYAALQRTFGGRTQVPATETTWELFSRDGMYRGAVRLPARYRPEAVDDLTVVGVGFDDLDLEYVVRYEVSPAGG